ncbi:ArsC/Spx/MgsR family protein [Marmoricola sp. RAF53]|uniref:ArsC/Spx/MgsR family protein n=1 Tax=Marmoricola sp. RAF53 TaxID=3233059 RepID=UPI003F96785A
MAVEIWINPACSKCRSAKADLDAAGVEYVERRYLDDPPTTAELGAVLDRLGLQPWEIARPAETREAGIAIAKDAEHRDAWIAALVAHPRAIQRPIITASDATTVVARDPATVAGVIAREL